MVHLLEARALASTRFRSMRWRSMRFPCGARTRLRVPEHQEVDTAAFDAAHELGHLVLHRHGSPQGREAEKEPMRAHRRSDAARKRAGARAVHGERRASDSSKKYWSVSVAALDYRLHAVGALSDWHYPVAIAVSEIAKRGYGSANPLKGIAKRRRFFQKVFAALRSRRHFEGDIASDLCVHVRRP
ncbi:MAG: ImmA/IrrE family metallo-endopeptidase [Burkholderiaceae bacterium]